MCICSHVRFCFTDFSTNKKAERAWIEMLNWKWNASLSQIYKLFEHAERDSLESHTGNTGCAERELMENRDPRGNLRRRNWTEQRRLFTWFTMTCESHTRAWGWINKYIEYMNASSCLRTGWHHQFSPLSPNGLWEVATSLRVRKPSLPENKARVRECNFRSFLSKIIPTPRASAWVTKHFTLSIK